MDPTRKGQRAFGGKIYAARDMLEHTWPDDRLWLGREVPTTFAPRPVYIQLRTYRHQSEQIDIVIYDRQYTPELYNVEGQKVIPAEGVYADRLDSGCVVGAGGFEALYVNNGLETRVSSPEHALAFFFLRLLHRLQRIGIVPAIDYDTYLAEFEPPA